ncbi:MAG TPA: CYTH domain-containing protein [Allosphingosinicella sp.]|jgi:adenylate cyclase
MGIEIERKFLVKGEGWRREVARSVSIRQGYLMSKRGLSVRIRTSGEGSWLTVKLGAKALKRTELEYPIPREDAEILLEACRRPILEKTRHIIPSPDGLSWEVDEFGGALAGLTLAEIELPAVDAAFHRPVWLGSEVTGDSRYQNANIHRLAP